MGFGERKRGKRKKGSPMYLQSMWSPIETWHAVSDLCCIVSQCAVLLHFSWTSLITQIHWTASFPFLLLPYTEAHVQYDLVSFPCTIISWDWVLYNINLGATTTTILSTRGVTIPIDLVSSATDSIRRCVVLFKPVPIPTSDPKSEFLCQLSRCYTEPAGSPRIT